MPDSPRQSHRSFTVRVPMNRYLEIARLAAESNTNLNVKVNELLALGLGENVKLETALARIIKRATANDGASDGED